MNRNLALASIVIGMLVIAAAFAWPRPSPFPASDLHAAFAAGPREHRASDARTLAAIAGLCAATVKADGEVSNPKFPSAGSIDAFRTNLRAIATGGASFQDRYPELPKILGTFFTPRVGVDDGQLDEARRRKWIEAFETLRDAATQTAEGL
jgi:hypothetical protein